MLLRTLTGADSNGTPISIAGGVCYLASDFGGTRVLKLFLRVITESTRDIRVFVSRRSDFSGDLVSVKESGGVSSEKQMSTGKDRKIPTKVSGASVVVTIRDSGCNFGGTTRTNYFSGR